MMLKPHIVDCLQPLMAGWLSHETPLDFLLDGQRGLLNPHKAIRQSADAIEGGAQATVVYAGLEASVQMLLTLGVDNIYAHVQAYHDRLEPLLVERGCQSMRHAERAYQSGILSVEVPAGQDVLRWHQSLASLGVATSTPDGLLRFAPHWPNALDEVERVISAVDQSFQ